MRGRAACFTSSRLGRAAALATALMAPIPAVADEPGGLRSGFYVGGHVGYIFGNANATLGDPTGIASAGGVTGYGAFFGGVQAGYEHFFASRLMLGIELDASLPGTHDRHRLGEHALFAHRPHERQ